MELNETMKQVELFTIRKSKVKLRTLNRRYENNRHSGKGSKEINSHPPCQTQRRTQSHKSSLKFIDISPHSRSANSYIN